MTEESIQTTTDNSPHPSRMNIEELRSLVEAMSWAALDLGQHLSLLNEVIHPDGPEGYQRAQGMAYAITRMPFEVARPKQRLDFTVMDETGLHRFDEDAL